MLSYNAIGMSQGGLFLRGVAQKCPQKMKNLITFGSPHQGIYGLPKIWCKRWIGWMYFYLHDLCEYGNRLINHFHQHILEHLLGGFLKVQFQYWHNPLNNKEYRRSNQFLADIKDSIELCN